MKKLRPYLLLNLLLVLFKFGFSQASKNELDSLTKLLNIATSDTVKLRLLSQLSSNCNTEDILKYAEPALEIAHKLLATKNYSDKYTILRRKSECLLDISHYFSKKENFNSAHSYLQMNLKVWVEERNKYNIARAHYKIGLLYYRQGNYNQALNSYKTALKIWNEIKNDAGMGETLNSIGFTYKHLGQLDTALFYYYKSYTATVKAKDKKETSNILNNIGVALFEKGQMFEALESYEKSIKLLIEVGDLNYTASTLNNIGTIHFLQGNIPKALEYYQQSLTTQKKCNNIEGIAISYNNFGALYNSQKNYDLAVEYFNKSLKIYTDIHNQNGIANSLNNIGAIYKNKGDFKKSFEYHEKALKIIEKSSKSPLLPSTLVNLGVLKFIKVNDSTLSDSEKIQNLNEALPYFFKSLDLSKKSKVKRSICSAQNNIGSVLYKLGDFQKNKIAQKQKYLHALAYTDSALKLAKELGYPENIRGNHNQISLIHSSLGNHQLAYEHYKQYIIYRDSLSNKEAKKATIKSELNFEFQKKEAVLKEQQEKEKLISIEKQNRQQIIIWSVGIGLLLVIIFALVVFKSLNTTKKQKLLIEIKQKEILDSIHYAKRIQKSLLPNEKYFEKTLLRLINNTK